MLASDSTLRSAAPLGPETDSPAPTTVLAGGTLVEVHPPRVGQADVLVVGDAVVQVGGPMPEGAPRIDISGCVLTPAFAVAHTHLYMSLACGMPPPPTAPRTLTDTLQWVWWALDKALDDELVHTSALVGAAMAAKAGVACLVDHHSSPRAIDGSLDRIEAALDEIGLRGVLCYETSDRDGRGRRDGGLKENRRFLNKVKGGKTRHKGLVGAHAMMTLNDDTLDALREQADKYEVGMHMHVAEDLTDHLDAERIRKSPMSKRLERLGIARKGSVVAHAVQLDAELTKTLTDAGAYIVTNPRSNMAHGVGLCGAGGPLVALGTDGVDNDVLAEARAYALRHQEARDGLAREVGMRIAASQALAAEHFGDAAPKIAAGARADLVVLDYEPTTPMTPSNVLDHVTRGWTSANVRHTLVGGHFVVRDKKLTSVDERELLQRARAAAGRLWERMQGYT
ncbi:MAG: amidohydrolase family protein [Deltaproteobacteria bacterium]|nr:amidohydrolase family protein [Deltaproteobacteria bacterium]